MAYFIVNVEVRIEGFVPIRRVISIKIEESWETLTQHATVEMPRRVTISKNGASLTDQSLEKALKKGLKIEILAGYNGELRTEFKGYIARVQTGTPTVLHCEDEMYMLKKMTYQMPLLVQKQKR